MIRPWRNGLDITRRSRDLWIIDFGVDMTEEEAALYEEPFEYVRRVALPFRQTVRQECCRRRWWIHHNARPEMRKALRGLDRYLGTPRVAKHRLFVRIDPSVLADNQLIVIARDDDYTFGVLHSHVHQLWALRMGTQLETRPRYTPTTTRSRRAAPPSVRGRGTSRRQSRTLTNLYNEMPTWLRDIHARLDRAVLAAYGWPFDLADPEILERILALNLEREPA